MHLLTPETKIKLSQISDLKKWITDRKYEIGEISPKTGLLKTEEGWVIPPSQMVHGNKTDKDPITGLYNTGGGEQHRSKRNNKSINKKDFTLKKQLKLTIENNPKEKGYSLYPGEKITNIVSFARGKGIDDIQRLKDTYKRKDGKTTIDDDWEKCKGNGIAHKNNKKRGAEIHWYQAKNVGQVEHKVKRWLINKRGQKK